MKINLEVIQRARDKVIGSDKRSFPVEDIHNSQNKAYPTSPENILEGLIRHFKRQKPTGHMMLDAVVSDGSKLAFVFIEVRERSVALVVSHFCRSL